MSYPKPQNCIFQLSLLMLLTVGIFCNVSTLSAQSNTRQGPDDAAQDPFDTPDDPFELPQVPTAPTDEQPAVNPNAVVFQNATVNEKYAGWRQASDGTGPERLDEILRSHWVMADDRGSLSGTVFGIEDADLGNLELFLLGNGREVLKTSPNEDGTFKFSNIRQGTYAFAAWGDNAFFAFGLNVLDYNEAADDNMPMSLEVTAVPNKTTINTDWIRYFAGGVKFPVYGRYDSMEGEDDPARLYGLRGLQLYMPASRPATSISSHQVIPASNGRLIGRVHQISTRDGRPVDLRGTRILLLQKDDVYAAVSSDSYGVFEFPEIPAGEYSCVAVGLDGLGCIGITVAEAKSMSSIMENEPDDDVVGQEYTPISFAMIPSESVGWLNDKAMKTAYQRIISTPLPDYNYDQQYSGSGCGPNCGNGCGCGRRPVRPGGYRPPPRSAVPKEQRFIPRVIDGIDRLLNRDTGQIPSGTGVYNGSGYNNGSGYYNGGVGYNYPSGQVAPGGSFNGGSAVPASPGSVAPSFSGSTTRNTVPGSKTTK